GRDAAAVVAEGDVKIAVIPQSGADDQLSPLFHGGASIEDEVDGHLPHLVAIDGYAREIAGKVADDRDMVHVRVIGGKIGDLGEQVVDVCLFQGRLGRSCIAQE